MTVSVREFDRLRRDFDWDISNRLRFEGGVWVTPTVTPEVSYPESGHASLMAVEDRSFWFKNRAQAIVEAVQRFGDGSCLWEVGAGNGHVSEALISAGISAVAVEPGAHGIANAAGRGVPAIRGVLAALELPDGSIGSAGMFDVLEHLQEPQLLLAELRQVLRTDGLLVLTVPASDWLWSDKDAVAGHYRRYSRQALDGELISAGFVKLDSRFLFPLLVPPMAVRYRLPFLVRGAADPDRLHDRVSNDLGGGGRALGSIVDAVFAVEGRLTRRFRMPFGTSVLGVYRKG